MVQALAERPKSDISKRTITHTSTGVHELVVFCPRDKTLGTLLLTDGRLMQTRKFTQNGDGIYHDCSSNQPCRLYHAHTTTRRKVITERAGNQ